MKRHHNTLFSYFLPISPADHHSAIAPYCSITWGIWQSRLGNILPWFLCCRLHQWPAICLITYTLRKWSFDCRAAVTWSPLILWK
jgi:hypothetical protein